MYEEWGEFEVGVLEGDLDEEGSLEVGVERGKLGVLVME